MSNARHISCPQCGTAVRIPLLWTLGLEMVFRCPTCRLPFKTGYKVGAVIQGLSLSISIALTELFVYLFSAYSMLFFLIALVPLWIVVSFTLRKFYMKINVRKIMKRRIAAAEIEERERQYNEIPEEERTDLPKDTSFE